MTVQRSRMLNAIRTAVKAEGEPREAYLYLILADQPIFTNAIDLNARWLSSDSGNETYRVGLAIQTALHVFADAEATAKDNALEKEKEAIVRLEEFAEAYPSNVAVLSILIDYFVEQGDISKVEGLLRRVPAEAVDDHLIWTCRGWYHSVRNELDLAREAFRHALEIHPCSPRAINEYAALLRLEQQTEKAAELQTLAQRGFDLRKQLLQLQTARSASPQQLFEIAKYAEACGDELIARALKKRLETMAGMSLDKFKPALLGNPR